MQVDTVPVAKQSSLENSFVQLGCRPGAFDRIDQTGDVVVGGIHLAQCAQALPAGRENYQIAGRGESVTRMVGRGHIVLTA